MKKPCQIAGLFQFNPDKFEGKIPYFFNSCALRLTLYLHNKCASYI
jgi:hypothetical protein